MCLIFPGQAVGTIATGIPIAIGTRAAGRRDLGEDSGPAAASSSTSAGGCGVATRIACSRASLAAVDVRHIAMDHAVLPGRETEPVGEAAIATTTARRPVLAVANGAAARGCSTFTALARQPVVAILTRASVSSEIENGDGKLRLSRSEREEANRKKQSNDDAGLRTHGPAFRARETLSS